MHLRHKTSVSEFMGKTFQAAQLTHERFLTIERAEYSMPHGHFGPKYLLQVSRNDDEKTCFLK